jgi:hypothetical protein
MSRLSSKALPQSPRDLAEFCLAVHHFDWYTDMSDDHGVYLRGRGAHAAVEAFAANNHPAACIWKDAQRAMGLRHMAHQLITRVADLALTDPDDTDTFWNYHKEFVKFCIGYLAATTSGDNMLTATMRDRIADLIPECPPDWKDKDRRNELIDKFIEDFSHEC